MLDTGGILEGNSISFLIYIFPLVLLFPRQLVLCAAEDGVH